MGAAALSSFGCGSLARQRAASPDFSVAFLTDPHVRDQAGAPRGFATAVAHALAQPRAPEMMITGGDLAFDIMETDKALADVQYDLFDQATATVGVPIHHTIGNHDCFGVHAESEVALTDPLYGKGYWKERFGRQQSYASFDHEGWHFVTLDTIGITAERGYRGFVDPQQLQWLDDDLAVAGKPTVVVGHIPILSNYYESMRGTEGGIPAGVAVVNAHEVIAVLLKHQVKLVLAGHLHVNEVFHYKGIEFATVGAVSGNWWGGPRDGFEEGYAMLDFFADEVSWRYVDYGWEVPEPSA